MSNDDEIPLVRRFVLHTDAECLQLVELLRMRHELARRGKVFQVIVSQYAPDRRTAQNARMWKGYLDPMEKQARMNGFPMPAKSWHLLMKTMFLPEICAKGIHKWKYLESGDRELTMSTGHLNEDEMDVYLHAVGHYATHELGVLLPANPRDIDPDYLPPPTRQLT